MANQSKVLRPKYAIEVHAEVFFLEDQSSLKDGRYVFAYRMSIRNNGSMSAQLIARSWVVRDDHGDVQNVQGLGVVGEKPLLWPGDVFQYTSGTSLSTPTGVMSGHYEMLAEDGMVFHAEVAAFELSIPRVLH